MFFCLRDFHIRLGTFNYIIMNNVFILHLYPNHASQIIISLFQNTICFLFIYCRKKILLVIFGIHHFYLRLNREHFSTACGFLCGENSLRQFSRVYYFRFTSRISWKCLCTSSKRKTWRIKRYRKHDFTMNGWNKQVLVLGRGNVAIPENGLTAIFSSQNCYFFSSTFTQ